jgi:hypothetical protein
MITAVFLGRANNEVKGSSLYRSGLGSSRDSRWTSAMNVVGGRKEAAATRPGHLKPLRPPRLHAGSWHAHVISALLWQPRRHRLFVIRDERGGKLGTAAGLFTDDRQLSHSAHAAVRAVAAPTPTASGNEPNVPSGKLWTCGSLWSATFSPVCPAASRLRCTEHQPSRVGPRGSQRHSRPVARGECLQHAASPGTYGLWSHAPVGRAAGSAPAPALV